MCREDCSEDCPRDGNKRVRGIFDFDRAQATKASKLSYVICNTPSGKTCAAPPVPIHPTYRMIGSRDLQPSPQSSSVMRLFRNLLLLSILVCFSAMGFSNAAAQIPTEQLPATTGLLGGGHSPTLGEEFGLIAPGLLESDATGFPEPACDGGLTGCESGVAGPSMLSQVPSHFVTYEQGWTLRPYDPSKTPFEVKVELHNQFRYTLFDARGEPSPSYTGNPRTVSDRNDFDINRGRLVFGGYAFDPDLGFYLNIDYSTVASDSILPLLAWISFRASDRLTMYFGLGKVPGTWEWQQTSRFTLGSDRSMATTFFRPSISAGVWATGSLTDQLHYTTFIGDGFNTLTLRADELDTQLAYSGISWWEPLGDFGVGFSDLECHDSLAIRLGHALTTTRSESTASLDPGPEGTVIRLTDGTRLVAPGALEAGETVNEFDIWLYSVHAGVKRRGFSLAAEYYFRWLRRIQTASGRELDSLFDHGFFAQSSAFVVPESLELFLRGSLVTGEQGNGDEVAAGLNWYLFGRRNARATAEWTVVDDSPAQQSRTGYVAGGSGNLFRVQLWTFF